MTPGPADEYQEADESPETPLGRDAEGQAEGVTDSLPEDLDVTRVGVHRIPDVARRRVAAVGYAIFAVACFTAAAAAGEWGGRGLAVAGVVLSVTAVYHWSCAWPLAVRESEALSSAVRTVGFPVGHASAQLGWRGLRSKPTWRVLVYSTENPPSKRGFVLVCGVTGEVLDSIVQENPENWAGD
ncbi:MAG: hypothetical protein KatS3mg008_0426 [Acidimicrobiales bacterium]|nr:MAG: hypothetical protein KatS3mg008_0426 [Acidimicrobiales bacterium]